MQILKVKLRKNGYLINDDTFVPNDPDNSDFKSIQKWIDVGGVVEPEFSLDELKTAKRAEINDQRDNNLIADLNYDNKVFQVSKDTFYAISSLIERLQERIIALEQNPTTEMILKDNTIVELDKDDLVVIRARLIDRQSEIIQARKRKDKVNSFQTSAEVEAYDITTIEE